jgi:hypothetical protein
MAKITDTMTDDEIYEIFGYFLGGDVSLAQQKREVEAFLLTCDFDVEECLNELKDYAHRELVLEGYYDY